MNNPVDDSFAVELTVPRSVDHTQLGKDIEEAWTSGLRSDPSLQDTIRGEGLSAQQSPFEAKATRAGAEPVTAIILVTLGVGAAKLTVKAANDIWDKIVLPRLIRKYGRSSIKKSSPANKK